jgi:adenylyltransferase/sulfurtransferase
MMAALQDSERYSRHIILDAISAEGQRRISSSSVLIVGCGGTGTVAANLLARAGVGHMKIIDGDVVDLTNIQRQALFTEQDVGKPKATAARDALRSINSSILVEGIADRFSEKNAEALAGTANLVMDCTDNMKTRFLINDVCVKLGKPWIYTGAISTYGMTAAFVPGGPCFKCMLQNVPEGADTCSTIGVLNAIPGIIAGMAVAEALKILSGAKPSEALVVYDAWSQAFQKVMLKKREDCECCVKRNFSFLNSRPVKILGTCGGFQISPEKPHLVDLLAISQKHGAPPPAEEIVVLNTEGCQITIFENGRTIIKGAEDVESAMEIYRKYVD